MNTLYLLPILPRTLRSLSFPPKDGLLANLRMILLMQGISWK